MQVIQFPTKLRRQPSPLSEQGINSSFVTTVRLHASAVGGKASYIVDIPYISTLKTNTTERCIVVAIPEVEADAIDVRSGNISVCVRRTEEGYPIACAMFAGNMVAVSAQAVNLARPLEAGRLHVLWVFKNRLTLQEYLYTRDMVEDLWSASCAANGHWRSDGSADNAPESTIEVHKYYLFDEAIA